MYLTFTVLTTSTVCVFSKICEPVAGDGDGYAFMLSVGAGGDGPGSGGSATSKQMLDQSPVLVGVSVAAGGYHKPLTIITTCGGRGGSEVVTVVMVVEKCCGQSRV